MTKAALALSIWIAAAPLWAAGQAKSPAPLRTYRQAAARLALSAYLIHNPEVDLQNLRAATLLVQYPDVDKTKLWTQFGARLRQKLETLVHNAQAPDSTPARVGQVAAALRLVQYAFKEQLAPAEQLQLLELGSSAALARGAAVKRGMAGTAQALAERAEKKVAEAAASGTIAAPEAKPGVARADVSPARAEQVSRALDAAGSKDAAAPASNKQAAFEAHADLLRASRAGALANDSVFYKLVRLARTNTRDEWLLLGILAQLAHHGIQKETRVESMLQRIPDIESVAEVAQSEQVKVQAMEALMETAARTRSHHFAEQASQAVKRLGTKEGSSARVRETSYAYLMREAKLAVGSGRRKAALALAEEVRQAAAEAKIDLRVISLEDPAAREIGRRHHLLRQVQDAAGTPEGLAATLLALAASLAAAWTAAATGLLAIPVAALAGLLTLWVGLQGLRHRAIGWAFAHMGLIAGHIAAMAGLGLTWAAKSQPEMAVLVWILGSAGLAFNALLSRESFDGGYAALAAFGMWFIAVLSLWLSSVSGAWW